MPHKRIVYDKFDVKQSDDLEISPRSSTVIASDCRCWVASLLGRPTLHKVFRTAAQRPAMDSASSHRELSAWSYAQSALGPSDGPNEIYVTLFYYVVGIEYRMCVSHFALAGTCVLD